MKFLLTILFLGWISTSFSQSLIHWNPRSIWDLSGASGYGSQRINDTTGSRKWHSVLGSAYVIADHGAANPRLGTFDYNGDVAGVQSDSTSTVMTRSIIHNGNTAGGQTYLSYFNMGNGAQRVFVFDFERIVDLDALYFHHGGTAHTNAFEVIITSNPLEVRRACFEYDSRTSGDPLTIDYTVTLTTSTYDSITSIGQSGRYMVVRINPNDGNTPKQGASLKNIFPYGTTSATTYSGTEIFPTWGTTFTRDTTQPVKYHGGKVVATPTGGTVMHTKFPNSLIWGGYVNATDTVAGSGGLGDTANIETFDPTSSSFKINLAMYGDPQLFNPSNKFAHEIEAYMAVNQPNRFFLKQLFNNGTPALQHVPLAKLGLDMRLQSTWTRYAWYFNFLSAVIGPQTPNTGSPYYAHIPTSRVVGYWTGGSGYGNNIKQWMIPYNENNMDFRPGSIPQSSWLPPIAFWAFHDEVYTWWKSLFPSRPFVMQGIAASNYDYIPIVEIIGKIFYQDQDYRICDIFNMHDVTVLNMPDIDGGCIGNINQQSVLPGYRQGGQRLQAFLDTMAVMAGGTWRNMFITEYSVASNKDFALPVTGCDVNVLSIPDIRSIRPTYRPHHVQGYTKLQQQIRYEAIQGLQRVWQYEAFDLVDTTSVFYNGNDGSQGDRNVGNNWDKAGLFISDQHQSPEFLKNYRVVPGYGFDSLRGQYKALYRHIEVAKKDSFCWVTMWGAFVDPSGNRTHTLPSDVSTIRHMRHDPTDYTGIDVGTSVSGNAIAIPSVFEPDYIFFNSPVLTSEIDDANAAPNASAGVDQTITLPTSSVSVSGSGSTDSDGTITGYLWAKISGPATFNIVSPTSVTTTINSLVAGTYVFQLQVTDNDGATDTDTVQITVNPLPPSSPDPNYILIRGRKRLGQ